jgi:hypothetical protein
MTNEERKLLDVVLWSERTIKQHLSIYNNIILFNVNFINIKFVQMVFNYYNNIEYPISCKLCKNSVNFYNKKYSIYCSNSCKNKDPDFIEQKNKSMLEKYGYISPMSNKETQLKAKVTTLNKWGVDNIAKVEDIKRKISDTKRNKSTESKEYSNNKRAETNIIKYGVDNVAKNIDIKNLTKENNNINWGVDYPIMRDDIKKKRVNNYLEKTGKSHHCHFKHIIDKIQSKRIVSIKEKYLNKLRDLGQNIVSYDTELSILCDECKNEFTIVNYLLYQRIRKNAIVCKLCNPLNSKMTSPHLEISKMLYDLGIEHETNNRSILKGKELDIYIPGKNIAIEYNGLYWHSEIYKTKDYHLNKKNNCENTGISLINIWEDDWLYKKDIVKSMLLNKLDLIVNKIYARKCHIKVVSNIKDVKDFLNNNHIQGYSSSSVKLGLYYNDELVSLMTFGTRATNGKVEYELIRFCNKINFSVIGSASKLFNYFIKNYEFDKIISYSDESMFSGDMYSTLGFKYIWTSEPNYYWIIDGIRKHRFNYNKKKLVKKGYDVNKTGVNIMHELGYVRIWGCGQKRWEFNS